MTTAVSNRICSFAFALALAALGSQPATATDVGSGRSALDGFDDTINFNETATLTMDAPLTGITTITVADGETGTILFQDAENTIEFGDADGVITLGIDSLLTIDENSQEAGFDFASAAVGRTLTITSSSAGTLDDVVPANRILLGSTNTLTFEASEDITDGVNVIVVSGTPTINATNDLTIATLAVAEGDDIDFNIADGKIVTVTNAVSLTGDSIIELIANVAEPVDTDDTLAFSGGLSLGETSSLLLTNDRGNVSGTVTVAADGVTIDVDGNASITAITQTPGRGDLNLLVTPDKTLTTTIEVNDNTLTIPTGEGGTITTVNLNMPDGTLDVDESATITSINQTANATVKVAAGMTLNTTIDVNANTLTIPATETGTITTVNMDIAGGVLVVNETMTINSVNMSADATIHVAESMSINSVNMSANATIDVTPGKALTATVDVNANTLTIPSGASGAISTVNLDTSGGTLIVNESMTINALNQSSAASITIAAGKILTATADLGTGNELTLAGTGTISTVNLDAGDKLRLNANTAITNLTVSGSATIDIASGVTWQKTVALGRNDVTLQGNGTLTDVSLITIFDTRTITVTSGSNITIAALDPGFSSASGTLRFDGDGSVTVALIGPDLPGNGDRIQKDGLGTLTMSSGISNAFANGGGVKLDIDAGAVVIGAPGFNDDITLDDDADEITVAAGASLTTFGSLTVTQPGDNVNFDTEVGSVVNLNSTEGAQTIQGAADDDFNLLGTVNIAGSDGDYTIADAFNYKFGNVSINSTGSFINNQPAGEIKFVPGSTVSLIGEATFAVNGQSLATRMILDTTTGADSFTINVGTSPNLTVQNVDLRRAVFTGGEEPAACIFDLSGVTFGGGTSNWQGPCEGDESLDEPDVVGGGIAPQELPPDEQSATAAEDGTATLSLASIDIFVEGLAEGTPVSVQVDDAGITTLTIGDSQSPDLVFVIEGLEDGAEITATLENGADRTIVVTKVDGSTVVLDLNALPTAAIVGFASVEDGSIRLTVSDPAAEFVGISIRATLATEFEGDPAFDITFRGPPAAGGVALKIVDGFGGLADGRSLGGGVTATATGLSEDAVVTVGLIFDDADLAAVEEKDLRLLKLNTGTGQFEPSGSNDVGVSESTGVLGDFGVNVDANSAWAEVSSLGTFAVGVPDPSFQVIDAGDPGACGSGGGMCGAMGMIPFMMTLSGFVALRRNAKRPK